LDECKPLKLGTDVSHGKLTEFVEATLKAGRVVPGRGLH
jgi:hypothetical protein